MRWWSCWAGRLPIATPSAFLPPCTATPRTDSERSDRAGVMEGLRRHAEWLRRGSRDRSPTVTWISRWRGTASAFASLRARKPDPVNNRRPCENWPGSRGTRSGHPRIPRGMREAMPPSEPRTHRRGSPRPEVARAGLAATGCHYGRRPPNRTPSGTGCPQGHRACARHDRLCQRSIASSTSLGGCAPRVAPPCGLGHQSRWDDRPRRASLVADTS